MDNCVRSIDSAIEQTKRIHVAYLLTQIDVTRTFVECATATTDERRRLRTLRKASVAMDLVQHFSGHVSLAPGEATAIEKALATLRQQLAAFQRKNPPLSASDVPMISGSLLKGARIYFFTPKKQALFAGDLFRMALRFRCADSPPPPRKVDDFSQHRLIVRAPPAG